MNLIVSGFGFVESRFRIFHQFSIRKKRSSNQKKERERRRRRREREKRRRRSDVEKLHFCFSKRNGTATTANEAASCLSFALSLFPTVYPPLLFFSKVKKNMKSVAMNTNAFSGKWLARVREQTKIGFSCSKRRKATERGNLLNFFPSFFLPFSFFRFPLRC